MAMQFKKATKHQAKLRMMIHGPSGAGKSFTGLSIATHLVPAGKVAALDTERGSLSKYADRFNFDVVEVNGDYHPKHLEDVIAGAAEAGYEALLVDSGSLFWNGPGGMLELVDHEAKRLQQRSGKFDSFGAWKAIDPIYRRMVQTITSAPMHIIMTLRAKQEYQKDDKGKIQKLGLAPEMRDGFQYEADVEGMLDIEHNLVIGKTRCEALDGKVFNKPGKALADILRAWLTDGAPVEEKPADAAPTVAKSSPKQETQPEARDEILAKYEEATSDADVSAADGEAVALGLDKSDPRRGRLAAARAAATRRVAGSKGAAA